MPDAGNALDGKSKPDVSVAIVADDFVAPEDGAVNGPVVEASAAEEAVGGWRMPAVRGMPGTSMGDRVVAPLRVSAGR